MFDFLKNNWWKVLSGLLLLYAIFVGFAVDIPLIDVVEQSMRNLFFHVGMWFGMMAMLLTGFIYSLRYLRKFDPQADIKAVEAVNVALLYGFLGIFTGMIWATFTWGTPWVKDPKLNGAAVGLIIYLGYMILRGSIEDHHKRAKVGAVFNIFAFVLWIVFVIIMPRMAGSSLHPATGDSAVTVLPMHLDPSMRIVFYPAMIGWILLATWIMTLRVRIRKISYHLENK